MKAEDFTRAIKNIGIDTLYGVPDSTLKQFCDYINTDGAGEFMHYVPANEGAAVGLATGSYLATGKPACIYMQNSGIGNIVNPLTSIANKAVYGIPMLFLTGFRGEPGVHDEPQHVFMGEITPDIFTTLKVPYSIIDKNTTTEQLRNVLNKAKASLDECCQYAIIIKKDTFETRSSKAYINGYNMVRENAIKTVLETIDDDAVIVSTTGKISREVYEESDIIKGHHKQTFLTVGGMGHASMIAYGYAVKRKDKKVICIDGDGAVLMHMGSLAFIGKHKTDNLIHICLNNDSHESVGGMPTGAVGMSYAEVAQDCGYDRVYKAYNEEELKKALTQAVSENGTYFIEAYVSLGARDDLGRPKERAQANKINFMKYHEE